MKILMISLHGDPLAQLGGASAGGQNTFVKELSLSMGEKDCEVDIITCRLTINQPLIEQMSPTVKVIRLEKLDYLTANPAEISQQMEQFFLALSKRVNLSSYSVIYTNYWLSGMLGLKIKEVYNLPWVHTHHSLEVVKQQAALSPNAFRESVERDVTESSSLLIASTVQEKKCIEYFISNQTPISVFPIGVSCCFKPQSESDEQSILYVGRLTYEKGFHILVEAFQKLNEVKKQEFRLVVAGGDDQDLIYDGLDYYPRSDYLIKTLKNVDIPITFLGSQQPQQLAKTYQRAGMVVIPSLYESFGLVAAEAQSCGCAIVASKVGGLGEIIEHERTGLHFENRNSNDLLRQINRYIEDKDFKKQMAFNAAVHGQATYHWHTITTNILHVLSHLANES